MPTACQGFLTRGGWLLRVTGLHWILWIRVTGLHWFLCWAVTVVLTFLFVVEHVLGISFLYGGFGCEEGGPSATCVFAGTPARCQW